MPNTIAVEPAVLHDCDTPPITRTLVRTPCADRPATFLDPCRADDAAALCDHCPGADACLAAALRLDAAHRAGKDPYGISGCCGGVWFEPGKSPRRIPHAVAAN